MQGYSAYTWDRIDEELSLHQIYKLLALWENKDLPTQIVDSKMLTMLIKAFFCNK